MAATSSRSHQNAASSLHGAEMQRSYYWRLFSEENEHQPRLMTLIKIEGPLSKKIAPAVPSLQLDFLARHFTKNHTVGASDQIPLTEVHLKHLTDVLEPSDRLYKECTDHPTTNDMFHGWLREVFKDGRKQLTPNEIHHIDTIRLTEQEARDRYQQELHAQRDRLAALDNSRHNDVAFNRVRPFSTYLEEGLTALPGYNTVQNLGTAAGEPLNEHGYLDLARRQEEMQERYHKEQVAAMLQGSKVPKIGKVNPLRMLVSSTHWVEASSRQYKLGQLAGFAKTPANSTPLHRDLLPPSAQNPDLVHNEHRIVHMGESYIPTSNKDHVKFGDIYTWRFGGWHKESEATTFHGNHSRGYSDQVQPSSSRN